MQAAIGSRAVSYPLSGETALTVHTSPLWGGPMPPEAASGWGVALEAAKRWPCFETFSRKGKGS
jgi:hypothetical protein